MSYYVISLDCAERGYRYLDGTPGLFWWNDSNHTHRKFTSIGQIRRFITAALRYPQVSPHGVAAWEYFRINHEVIPASEVLTGVHTMGLLRSVQ